MSNIANSCLICLVPKENDFDRIFIASDTDTNVECKSELALMYEEVFNLDITRSKRRIFPEYMCAYCTLQLKLLSKFKKKAKDSYKNVITFNELELNDNNKSINNNIKSEEPLNDLVEEIAEDDEYSVSDINDNKDINSTISSRQEFTENNEIELEIQQLNYDDGDEFQTETIIDANDTNDECFEVHFLDTESIKESEKELNNCTDNNDDDDDDDNDNNDNDGDNDDNDNDNDDDNDDAESNDHITIISKFSCESEGNTEEYTISGLSCSGSTNNYCDQTIKRKFKIPQQKYECNECKITFYHKFHLSEHRKSKHPPVSCTICSKRMLSMEGLDSHMKVHQGLPGFKCTDCGKTFNQKQHLNYHIQNYHSNERKYKCEICSKRCLTSSDLKIHMRTHNDERRYECDICHNRFRVLTHMKNHRYSHFAKSIECPHCLLKYSSPSTLRTHIRSVHEGVCPYECAICQKKFKRKHHMLTHLKIHTKKQNLLEIKEDDYMDLKNTADDEINEIYLDEVLPDSQMNISILSE